jgi:cytochrome c-type biogenesis protein CcmH
MGEVDWIPALGALAVGLVGGAIVAWRVYRSGHAAAAVGGLPVGDLEVRSEALLRQLRELDDAAAKRTPEQLARERYALELEAARALRELERTQPEASTLWSCPEPVVSATSSVTADRPALRGFLWGTGTVVSMGLLLFLLSHSTQERREGGTPTGSLPGEERTAPHSDPELARLEATVSRSPEDIQARLDLARAYLMRQRMMAVWNETRFVLERSPGEPRALSYRALVRLAMGQGEMATQMLNQALADRPDFLEGYLYLAIVYMRTGRAREAEATIDRTAHLFPEEEKKLRGIWSGIRRATPAGAPAEVRDSNARRALPPVDSARRGSASAPPSRAASQDGKGVRGAIDLDPALKGQLEGRILFVMLRPEAFGAGPPLAAKRIRVSSFPVTFDIGPADSMTGEALPDRVLLQARLDSDGDPTTRDRADPVAQLDGIKSGSSGVTLTLARQPTLPLER